MYRTKVICFWNRQNDFISKKCFFLSCFFTFRKWGLVTKNYRKGGNIGGSIQVWLCIRLYCPHWRLLRLDCNANRVGWSTHHLFARGVITVQCPMVWWQYLRFALRLIAPGPAEAQKTCSTFTRLGDFWTINQNFRPFLYKCTIKDLKVPRYGNSVSVFCSILWSHCVCFRVNVDVSSVRSLNDGSKFCSHFKESDTPWLWIQVKLESKSWRGPQQAI